MLCAGIASEGTMVWCECVCVCFCVHEWLFLCLISVVWFIVKSRKGCRQEVGNATFVQPSSSPPNRKHTLRVAEGVRSAQVPSACGVQGHNSPLIYQRQETVNAAEVSPNPDGIVFHGACSFISFGGCHSTKRCHPLFRVGCHSL